MRLPASAACCRNRYWRSGKALAGSGGDGGVWVDFGIWAEAEENLFGDHDARSGWCGKERPHNADAKGQATKPTI